MKRGSKKRTHSRSDVSVFDDAYPIARRIAQVRAVAAVLSGAIPASDRQDLEQEGLIACWAALPLFNPERASLPTFLERVVATAISSVLRRSRARKRSLRGDYQLLEPFKLLLWTEFRVDIERVLRQLATRERIVARLLAEYGPAEIARRRKSSRSAVYRSIDRIRTALREAGFGS